MYSRSRFILLTLIGVSLFPLTSCHLASNSTQRLSLANHTSEKKALKHNFAKVPYEEQAQILIALLKKHKFAEIEDIMRQHIKNWTSSRGGNFYPDSVMRSIFSSDYSSNIQDPAFIDAVDRWIEESPNSSLAYLFRSNLYYKRAWKARGQKYNKDTPDQSRIQYQELLKESALNLQQAYELDDSNPLVLLDLLQLGRNIGVERDEYEFVFDRLIQQDPYLTSAYTAKAMYLGPQWSGSKQELLNFVQDSMDNAPRKSSMPMVVIQAHNVLASRSNKSKYWAQSHVWDDVEYSYKRLIEDFPEAGLYPAWFAEVAYKAYKDDIAKTYIQVALSREPNHPKILKIKEKIDSISQ